MASPEFSGIPPTWDRDDVNALLDHGLEKPSSYIARKKGSNYELIHGGGATQAGMIIAAATDTDALVFLNWLKNNAPEHSQCFFKHGDYETSAKFSTTKKLRFIGEGLGTRIIRSGSGYDAIDPTNLSLFNIVWEDDNSVLHDASFDPNMFETALKETVFFGSIEVDKISGVYSLGQVVLFVPTKNRIVVGLHNKSTNYGEIYISDDFGKTWTKVYTDTSAGYGWRCTWTSKQGTLLIGGEMYNIRSTDNGKTWSRMTDLNVKASFNFTEDIIGNLYFCLHGSYIYKSTNQGVSWTQIFDLAGEDNHLHGCFYDRWRDCFWVTIGDVYDYIRKYNNDFSLKLGEWQISYKDSTKQLISCIVTRNTLFFTSDEGGRPFLARTKTDMSDYTIHFLPTDYFAIVNNIYYSGVFGDLLTVWGSDYAYFVWSHDNGETWCYTKIGDDKTVEWACDAGNHILIITQTILVSIPKGELRSAKSPNELIMVGKNFSYNTAGGTAYSQSISIRKFKTVKVFSKTDGADGFSPLRYQRDGEYQFMADINHTAAGSKVSDITSDFLGSDFISFRRMVSTQKLYVALMLSDPR